MPVAKTVGNAGVGGPEGRRYGQVRVRGLVDFFLTGACIWWRFNR